VIGSRKRAGDMAASERPNILFFFPDQHRFDWLGAGTGGAVRTPNLDALAARGARFTNAVCPSPLCAPSRACLAAGVEYDRCDTPDNSANYPLEKATFYRRLRDGGYHVMGCGKFDLAKALHDWQVDGKRLLGEWGFSDGIDSEGKWDGVSSGRETPRGPYMAYLESRHLRAAHVEDFDRRRGDHAAAFPTPLPDDAYGDNWVARNGLDLLAAAPAGRPWFLQVNFPGPHDPWDITERMERSVRGRTLPLPVGDCACDADAMLRVRQNYSAMVENIDRWVGACADRLHERGELDRTLIVYSSDHGEMLGDHGRWGKSHPYHPSVAVPLIVAGPGVRGGAVLRGPATVMDLAATFLDFARVPVPADMDSRSLKPLLAGRGETHRGHVLSGLHDWRMAFDGRYKLIRGYAPHPAPLLFDLHADPHELHNLAPDAPAQVRRLSAVLGARA